MPRAHPLAVPGGYSLVVTFPGGAVLDIAGGEAHTMAMMMLVLTLAGVDERLGL